MKKHIDEELIDLTQKSTKGLAEDIEMLQDRVVKKMKKHIDEELIDLTQKSTKGLAEDIERLQDRVASIESCLGIVVVPAFGKQPRKTSYLKAKSQKPKIKYQSTTARIIIFTIVLALVFLAISFFR
jgi:hypothetical protein